MTPKWLAPAIASLNAARKAGRLPHALLIHGTPGGGGDWLANWAASVAMCLSPDDAPCGKCIGCVRVANNQHPDLLRIVPIEDSKQLRIEQVRELAEELALTSHQGGYKVGLLSPADSLNSPRPVRPRRESCRCTLPRIRTFSRHSPALAKRPSRPP